MNIETNNQPRQPMSGLTLELFVGDKQAAKIRRQFDHLTDEEFENDYFITYKGFTYALSDFMRVNAAPDSPMYSWHGVVTESYFSGVLIKQCDDGDVIVGRYFS